MQEAFHHGGWGMYPTTLFGLIMLGTAVLYAMRPTRRNMRIVKSLGALVMLSGLLGFVTGCIKGFTAVAELPPGEVGKIALVCVGESLNNVGLAFSLLILTTIITTLGTVRSANDKGELVDPRG